MFGSRDDKRSQLHVKVLNVVLNQLISTAKQESPEFKEVFSKIYHGGSFYEGLKVKSTPFEYDLNVVFGKPKSSWTICNLGKDYRRPHFASLETNDHNMSSAWKDLLAKNSQGNTIVSPSKMFKLLQTAVDRALTKMDNKLILDGKEYK